MRSIEFDTFVTLGESEEEIDVMVEADVESGYPDTRDEPGSGPEAEITLITRQDDGKEIAWSKLGKYDQDRLIQMAYQAQEEREYQDQLGWD